MAKLKHSVSRNSLSLVYFFALVLLISPAKFQPTAPPVIPISTNASYYYNLCAPSTCNNFTLPYPFALPTPCHPSPMQTVCHNNRYLLLHDPTSSDTFRVLSINFTDPTIITVVIASNSLFTCGAQVTRPNYANFSTFFTLLLQYIIGTHFNCTAPIATNSVPELQNASCLGCENQDPSDLCYYAPGLRNAPNCETYNSFTLPGSFNASVKDMRGILRSGFGLTYAKPSVCQGCEATGGRCGANPSSNGSFICFCPSSVHRVNCSDGIPEDLSTWVNELGRGGSTPSRAVVAAISGSVSVLIVGIVVALVVIFVRRRKHNFYLKNEKISSISPARYSYSQLKKFTNNFSSKLGEGGFGVVYNGTIHRSGSELPIAVKILKNSRQTKKQFMNEVTTIGSIHHHNLVCMLGYCADGEIYALIYEFLENRSLDLYIFDIEKEKCGVEAERKTEYKRLNSKEVYSIALETARGILYLHQGCRNKILHCDIKPSNVLLDSNFSAKVADFGLARMIDKDRSHVSLTGVQGTPGYAAPEMWLKTFGPVTEKSDVYSYGMLLFEMIGRRKNYDPETADSSQVYFPEWIYNKVERDELSLLMEGGGDDDSSEIFGDERNRNEEDQTVVQRMCLASLWCIQPIPSNRPSMDRVVQMLEGHVAIGIPPNPFPQNTARSHETDQDALV